LVAGGHWRAFAAAAAGVTAWAVAAGAVFGWSLYPMFFQSMLGAGAVIVQAGALEDFKQQSVYALAHVLGAGPAAGWAWQVLVAAAAGVGVAWLWRAQASWPCRAAALLVGMMAASPYSGIYDFPLVAAAVAILVSARTRPVEPIEGFCLAAAFLAPFAYSHVPAPIGPAVYAILALAVVLRARQEACAASLPAAAAVAYSSR
jgi:hypothetical protein